VFRRFTLAAVAVRATAGTVFQVLEVLVVVEGQTQVKRQTMHKTDNLEQVVVVEHRDLEPQAPVVVVL
jgi:hypothetical protein